MGRLRKLDLSSNKLGDRATLLQSYCICSMEVRIAPSLLPLYGTTPFIGVHGRIL